MRASEAVCRHMLTHSDICYACERGRGNVKGLVCSGDGSSEHRASVVESKQAVGVAPRPARRCIRQHTSTYNIRQHKAERKQGACVAPRPAMRCEGKRRKKRSCLCIFNLFKHTRNTCAQKEAAFFLLFFLIFFLIFFLFFFNLPGRGSICRARGGARS